MILQPESSHKNVGNGLLDQAELSCATLANGVPEQIADVEESAEYSSAHWIVRLSG